MILWDPPREAFRIPWIDHPVAWYGVFFAIGVFIAYALLVREFTPTLGKEGARREVDRFAIYGILGIILGARIFHVFFYENPTPYLHNPLLILKTWEGGLASHGGALGLFIGSCLFSRVSSIRLPDLLEALVIPAAFAGGMIRIGNFINQEIVGTATSLPWGVLFLHPADGGPPLIRHPVQLYEALFYWALGFFFLKKREQWKGRLFPLFLIGAFTGRFLLEWFKEEQSAWLSSSLSMGQYLSLPIIIWGVYLLIQRFLKNAEHSSDQRG